VKRDDRQHWEERQKKKALCGGEPQNEGADKNGLLDGKKSRKYKYLGGIRETNGGKPIALGSKKKLPKPPATRRQKGAFELKAPNGPGLVRKAKPGSTNGQSVPTLLTG